MTQNNKKNGNKFRTKFTLTTRVVFGVLLIATGLIMSIIAFIKNTNITIEIVALITAGSALLATRSFDKEE